jgi:asparagine N-glycosylation enzyme membrane subunit Stt3
MSRITTIASILIVALGLLHCCFTFYNYDGVSFDAVWFLGSGVAIVLAGFINIAMLREGSKDTVIWTMALITNVLFLLGFVFASYMMRQPQVFFGAILFLATTINSFIPPRASI